MGKNRRGFERRSPSKAIRNKILIGCEDKTTSPNYFNAIRKELRISKERIDVFHPDCTDPLNIVQSVIDKRQALKIEKAWAKEDLACAVFDGDEHEINNPKNRLAAIELAKNKDIQLVIINPSFELWYLLHFRDCLSRLHRDEALKLLKGYITDYEKSGYYYPAPLGEFTSKAIARAKNIQQQIDRDELDKYSNPCCSKLPDLVAALLNMKRV
jgi:hypothetical protein